MKTRLFLISLIVLSVATHNLKAQNNVCTLKANSEINSQDYVKSIKTDVNGCTYIGGFYHSTQGGYYYAGSKNFYVRKYSPSNNLIWEKKMQPYGSNVYYGSYLTDMEIDSDGNVYAIGNVYSSRIEIDTFSKTIDYNFPKMRFFIIKFDSTGTLKWINYSEGQNAGVSMPLVSKIKYVSPSKIYISSSGTRKMYYGSDSVSFPNKISVFQINSDGEYIRNMSLNKYNSTYLGYNMAYVTNDLKTSYGARPDFKISNTGKIFFTGLYKSNYNPIDTFILRSYVISGSYYYPTAYIGVMDTTQVRLVFNSIGTTKISDYKPLNLFDIDNDENIYQAAQFDNNSATILGSISPTIGSGSMITKFNSSGSLLWHVFISRADIYSLNTTYSNEIIITGEFNDSITYYSPTGVHTSYYPSNTNKKVFIISVDNQGELKWVTHLESTTDVSCYHAEANKQGTLHLIAKANGTPTIEGNSLINSNNSLIYLKYNRGGDCTESNTKYLYLKNISEVVNNCNLQNIQLQWNSKNVSFINISFSADSGNTWTSITNQIPAQAGTFSWIPPSSVSAGDLLFKISGNGNDSIYQSTISYTHPLHGVKTVGGISPNYPDIVSALNDITKRGICSDLTLKLRNGIYNERFVFRSFKGMGQFKLTIESESGDSTQVIINDTLKNTFYFIILEDLNNIDFRNITFHPTSTNYQNNFTDVKSSNENNMYSRNILFDGCIFKGKNTLNITGNDNTVKNCLFEPNISNKSFGFRSSNLNVTCNNNKVINSVFQSLNSVYFSNQSSGEINGNIFRNNCHVEIHECIDTLTIKNNRIHSYSANYNWLTTKYSESDSLNLLVYNNFFSSTTNLFTLEHLRKAAFYYNNFSSKNTNPISVNSIGMLEAKNNIFYTLNVPQIINFTGNNSQIASDFNCYYTNNNNDYLTINGTGYNSLSNINSSTGLELHSLVANPQFINDTNLRIQNALLYNIGTPIPFIQNDIDGDFRNPFSPDIGADEVDNTSIKDKELLQFSIFPNPANDLIYTNIHENIVGKIELKVVDCSGKVVLEKTFYGKTEILDISNFQQGFYFITLKSNDRYSQVKKIVIIR